MLMPRALAPIVDQIARQSVGKDWGLYAALLERWPEIVGQDYARDTTPVKMTFPHQPNEVRRRGGTLYVRLPKGLAMEFTFRAEQIRQRINGYFGYDVIARVAFDPVHGTPPKAKPAAPTTDPATLAALREQTEGIEDKELSAALEGLGAFIWSKNSPKNPRQ